MKIFKPIGGSHNGKDTFRELLDLWAERDLCTIEDSPDDYVWAVEPGNILLYDYPRIDDRPIPPFNHGLFGNSVPKKQDCYAWIFWARRPRVLERIRTAGIPEFEDRTIESIFLGKIENKIQRKNRTRFKWSKSGIEVFHCPRAKSGQEHYRYTQDQYFQMLLRSRFGLCLPGYGPKCNREIELLGTGVVPIFTPGVDNSYFEPLQEDLHFICVSSPQEIRVKIDRISPNDWREMQMAGLTWYERNASVLGSFRTTMKIISRLTSPDEAWNNQGRRA